MKHRTAGGAIIEASHATTLSALPAVHLPAAEAHPAVAGIVLVIKADRARVLQGSGITTRGTRRITASATATLFPTHVLVSSNFPMGFLTPHAAVVHALAPPATLHRAETTCFLAVGAHQPTPDPTFLVHLVHLAFQKKKTCFLLPLKFPHEMPNSIMLRMTHNYM
jgi:hypothetical protein